MSEAVTPSELDDRIEDALAEHEQEHKLEELEDRIEDLEEDPQAAAPEISERDAWRSEQREHHQQMLAKQDQILESLSELRSASQSTPMVSEPIAALAEPAEALEVEIPEPAAVPAEEEAPAEEHRGHRAHGILRGRLARHG